MIIKIKRWPELQPSVIARLHDTNAWVARDAAETLAAHGDINAQKAMWRRLRRFHLEWKNREHDLRYTPNMPGDLRDAMAFQFGLVQALGVLTDAQITDLQNLTVGAGQDSVAQWHWRDPMPLMVSISGAKPI